jgi:molybdenum-dependent DNA-binding transcriptional regulator ModE
MEKRHKEEIVRIREEQIKLMAQLMLAGGIGSGASGTGLSEKERKDMIDSLQKIIEKPIIIKQDSSRNVVGR